MPAIIDKIYPHLPVGIQNIGISAYGLFWQKRRFGGIYNSELKKFKEREEYSAQQWRDYQTVELRKLIRHAFLTVPFYNKKYSESGFKLVDFERFELNDLKHLPFLEKKDLREFGNSKLISSKCEIGGNFFASSGSTGTPVNTLYSKPMHQKWTAGYEARVKNWAGVSKNDTRGMIGGRRIIQEGHGKAPFYRWNIFEKQVYFSAYHINPKNIDSYLEGIINHQVDYMMGYAMSNYFVAKFLIEYAIRDIPQLKAVIMSSEKMTNEMRKTFQKAYGCKSFDTWSSVEACGQISECEFGSYHVSPDIGILEFLNDDNQSALNDELANIVCTSIINFDQPLIRYRIGDTAIVSDNKCRCGREMQTVKEIGGRIEDIVIGKDGRKMVRFHGIFINIPGIVEAQVIQNDLEDFEILISATEKINDKHLKLIEDRMESQLGKIKLNIIQVSKIPRGPNGKFKAVVSRL